MPRAQRAMVTGLAMLAVLVPLAASPASAQPLSFPTSSTPATGIWSRMTPSSFEGTVKSAVEQCLRDAAIDDKDLLTPQKCERLQSMLTAGQCQEVLVPDGVVHDFMNGRQSGKSFVTRNVKKQLGRSDRALLCDLGQSVHAYWYTGIKNVSCNNIGISINVPLPVALPPPPKPPEKRCRLVTVRKQSSTESFTFYSGFVLPNYCPDGTNTTYVPSLLLQNGGTPDETMTQELVCD